MGSREAHVCQCPSCRAEAPCREQGEHYRLNLLMSRLDEQERRWLAASESLRIGHGGDTLVSQVTGLHVDTIRRGRDELEADLRNRPVDRVRVPGGGRPPVEKKLPNSSRPS